MLTIRLQRAGKKNSPDFRIILTESTSAANKKFNEILGNYNPRTKAFSLKNAERVNYWISQHVKMSPTVENLFITQKILTSKKVKAFSLPKKEVKAEESAPATPAVKAEEVEATTEPEKTEDKSIETPAAE